MIGKTFSHYRVVKRLGRGGMGQVFLAQDLELRRKVALKILSPSFSADEMARRRFEREAMSTAALDHPFICKLYEAGTFQETQYLALEYVDGQTLDQRLKQDALTPREALRLALEVSEAVHAAHAQGIVHRDIKPTNIMLTARGHPKIMDFGLAKRIPRNTGEEKEITTTLTREGSTIGTLAYMSPEQILGHPLDAKSDIFSLGIVFFELFAHAHPFRQSSSIGTVRAILEDDPRIEEYLGYAPEALQTLLTRMLQKDRSERCGSMAKVLAVLESSQLFSYTRQGTPLRRRYLWLVAIVFSLLAALLFYLALG